MIIYIKNFEEGVCPVCKGKLEYNGQDRLQGFHWWTCEACGTTGREGYNDREEFDGHHYYVRTPEGEDVQFQFVEELECITPEEARSDILAFLQAQDEAFFTERNMTKTALLADEETLEEMINEHLRCVNRYGCERDWSCEDACAVDPSFPLKKGEWEQQDQASEAENKVTIKYQDLGICPFCGGDDVEVVKEDDGYGEVWYEYKCSCGASWKQDLSEIEVSAGYSNVKNARGEDVEVVVEDAPVVDASTVIPLLAKCFECDSELCAFNPHGICKYALIYGQAPELGENGCMSMIVKPDDNWLDGIELEEDHQFHSAEEGDYSPSSPWNAPGMSAKDFIR